MINEQFAYITHQNGTKFQVLKFDDEENPIDWDEDATKEIYNNYIPN